MQAFIEDSERIQKTYAYHSQIPIGEKVDLCIFEHQVEIAIPFVVMMMEFAVDLTLALHQPAIANWKQQNRAAGRNQHLLVTLECGREAGIPSQDGHTWLHGISLCHRAYS